MRSPSRPDCFQAAKAVAAERKKAEEEKAPHPEQIYQSQKMEAFRPAAAGWRTISIHPQRLSRFRGPGFLFAGGKRIHAAQGYQLFSSSADTAASLTSNCWRFPQCK
jgi:hypothetical protein